MPLVRVRGPEEVLTVVLAECKDARVTEDGVIADCDAIALRKLVARAAEVVLEFPP